MYVQFDVSNKNGWLHQIVIFDYMHGYWDHVKQFCEIIISYENPILSLNGVND